MSAVMDTATCAVDFGSLPLAAWDASGIEAQLNCDGYALLPGLFLPHANALSRMTEATTALQAVSLSPTQGQALPPLLAAWREALYPRLVPLANRWREALGEPADFPDTLAIFDAQNRAAGQTMALSHLNRLGSGDEVPLRQDTGGTLIFPLQVVGLLSAPGEDFTGGAFILTEQRPRMQSRPSVVPLRCGDAAIICTGPRPVRGSQGVYRVNVRHAVGRVRSGQRVGLSLSFHSAQ